MLILFGSFIILLVMGVPVLFTLGLSSLLYIMAQGEPLTLVPRLMVDSLNGFVYLALPLFMLSGELMGTGGVTRRMINFAKVFVGRVRGGLAYVNVAASFMFASVQGLATADTAAIGRIMIPAMKKEGYDGAFAAALTASAATCGGLFPPSLLLIIYGVTTSTSIGALFLAAVIPGIVITVTHMAYVFVLSLTKEQTMPRSQKMSAPEARKSLLEGLPTGLVPLTILGGILGGYFTATEAAGVACLIALCLALINREMSLKAMVGALWESGKTSGGIMLIMGTSALFAYVLTAEQIPLMLSHALLAISDNIFVILLIVNVFLLFVGTFMDPTPAVVVLGPVLAPALVALGLDPIHVGIIISYNLIIGLITPPSAVCLFVVTAISGETLERVSWAVVPPMMINCAVLMLITYVPFLTTWLPGLMGL